MNAVTKEESKAVEEIKSTGSVEALPTKNGLELLRGEVPLHLISHLPKPTKAQTESLKNDSKLGIRCTKCGGWHHKDVAHLDYVGHAAVTHMLLAADKNWTWKPVAFGALPAGELDKTGGMWIELTVCGVTRLGYGDAPDKVGGNAVKERIGDAIRNAAMRFGAALELWHKGDLHAEELENADPVDMTGIPSGWTPQEKPAEKITQEKEIVKLETKTEAIAQAEQPKQIDKPSEPKPQAKSDAGSAADTTIVSKGEAQFLRNKLEASGEQEDDLCELFSVSSTSFDTATKDQWAAIRKHLTGK